MTQKQKFKAISFKTAHHSDILSGNPALLEPGRSLEFSGMLAAGIEQSSKLAKNATAITLKNDKPSTVNPITF